MNRNLFATIVMAMAISTASAQDQYAEALKEIETNSLALAAYREQAEAQKLEGKVGLTPSDPEVEVGLLWGSPEAIGRRRDVSISQELDFPTVYVHLSRLSRLKGLSADHLYAARRMQLLLEAKKLLIEMVSQNALASIYNAHLEGATRMAEAYEKMELTGEASRLDLNKALLNLARAESLCREAAMEQERIATELQRLNGGKPIDFQTSSYATPLLPADFEAWRAAMHERNPEVLLLNAEADTRDREVKLAKAEGLPRLKLGYMGEFTDGENYQGITLGLSIPLWENRGKVRHAKAAALYSRTEALDAMTAYDLSLSNLYRKARSLEKTVEAFKQTLQAGETRLMLQKAFNAGEINLAEYVVETDYLIEAETSLIEAQRDLELVMAELGAPDL